MSKATSSSAASASVATRIGTLNFQQVNANKFLVRCRGKARIRISLDKTSGMWKGILPTSKVHGEVEGKTPELCFKRSVASFWN